MPEDSYTHRSIHTLQSKAPVTYNQSSTFSVRIDLSASVNAAKAAKASKKNPKDLAHCDSVERYSPNSRSIIRDFSLEDSTILNSSNSQTLVCVQ